MTWREPSRSRRRITAIVDAESVNLLGPRNQSAMTDLMLEMSLGNRETRARIPPITSMMPQLEERIRGRRSDTRWNDLSGVLKQFIAWNRKLEAETNEEINLDLAWRIIWFVEAKIESSDLKSLGSALKYVKNLTQCVQEIGFSLEEEVINAYKQSLKRAGAEKPEHQAPPASVAEMRGACQFLTETEALGLRLAWMTASRIGEMSYLTAEHVAHKGNTLWTVEFPYHKGDPFRLGTGMAFFAPEDLHRLLLKRFEWLPHGSPLTDLTTARASAALKRVNPELSAHSIKRGALVLLLRSNVPLGVIQAIAKHKDLETLYRYLPRTEVAMSLGLHEATKFLH